MLETMKLIFFVQEIMRIPICELKKMKIKDFVLETVNSKEFVLEIVDIFKCILYDKVKPTVCAFCL